MHITLNFAAKTLTSAALIAAMSMMGCQAQASTAPAHAVIAPTVSAELAPAQVEQAMHELAARGAATSISADGTRTFHLNHGIALRFEKDTTQRVGGGMDGWKPYVVLNRDEQAMLIGGGAAALRAAICAIPVVGTAACIVASALVGAAAGYLQNHRCPGNLRVTVDNARCE